MEMAQKNDIIVATREDGHYHKIKPSPTGSQYHGWTQVNDGRYTHLQTPAMG